MVTMTSVALDVHARSTQLTGIDMVSGEVVRARLSADPGEIVEFLCAFPQPVSACYEAGPTGFGLARAAIAAGIDVQVIAPSKTPRKAGEQTMIWSWSSATSSSSSTRWSIAARGLIRRWIGSLAATRSGRPSAGCGHSAGSIPSAPLGSTGDRLLDTVQSSQARRRLPRAGAQSRPVRRRIQQWSDHEDRLTLRAPSTGRSSLEWRPATGTRCHAAPPSRRRRRPDPADQLGLPTAAAPHQLPIRRPPHARQQGQHRPRPRADVLLVGRRHLGAVASSPHYRS